MDLASSDVVQDLGDAIRAVCNSSLVMLYTAALLIYGIAINRSRAWRMEGGTASFGVLAIGIGLSTSAIIFIEIKEDRLTWLQHAVWCILLWQSWITFWWFVSTGMYAGEVADRDMREALREDRKQKKRARRRRRRAGTALPSIALSGTSSDSVMARIARGLRLDGLSPTFAPSLRVRRSTQFAGTDNEDLEADEPLSPLSPNAPISDDPAVRRRARVADPDQIELADLSERPSTPQGQAQRLENSTTGSDISTTDPASSVTNMFARIFLRPAFINRLLGKLSAAHDQAVRTKAMELPTINSNNRMAGPLGGIGGPSPNPQNTDLNMWQSGIRRVRLKASDSYQ